MPAVEQAEEYDEIVPVLELRDIHLDGGIIYEIEWHDQRIVVVAEWTC